MGQKDCSERRPGSERTRQHNTNATAWGRGEGCIRGEAALDGMQLQQKVARAHQYNWNKEVWPLPPHILEWCLLQYHMDGAATSGRWFPAREAHCSSSYR